MLPIGLYLRRWGVLSILLACSLFTIASAHAQGTGSDERLTRLSLEHREWLERDVVYLITDRERDVFLSLESLQERERFIEAFWRRRDNNPVTPVNEFREEHYRRIDYADRFLGRETYRRGWQTDRGRYYILLGAPVSVQRFEGYNEMVSAELWFYQGDLDLGLPSHFYLLFYKRNDIGEFQLYHPVVDGPASLLRRGSFMSSREVLESLRRISMELASASRSYDPNDTPDYTTDRASLGTDQLLARIEDVPARTVRTDYIDAWLKYRNEVSAEYSFNFVPSRSVFSVLEGPEATPLVHFSVELDPENFALEANEDGTKFYATLEITVEVRTSTGANVLAQRNEAYLELDPSELQEIRATPFAYYGVVPLIPGDFDVTVILRNRVDRRYTAIERRLHVEELGAESAALSDVVLAFRAEATDAGTDDGLTRGFRVGSMDLEPAAESVFSAGETAYLLARISGALPQEPEQKVSFDLIDASGDLLVSTDGYPEDGVVMASLTLQGIPGGNYDLRARLLSRDAMGGEKTVPLTVSPRSVLLRPGFNYRHGFRASVPGIWGLVRGEQLLNLGRTSEAQVELEQAVARGGRNLPIAWWKLAEVHLRKRQPDRALALLAPMETAFSGQYEVIAGLGFAYHQKQDHERTVEYLTRAREIRPADTALWNALGDAHEALGDLEAARNAFERSLELDSEQASTRERLGALAARRSPR